MSLETEEIGGGAWAQFLAAVDDARIAIGCSSFGGEEAWFRGHTSTEYKLVPSLFRTFKDLSSEATWDAIFQTESDLFWEFAARARQIHGTLENDWDILFAMQHYGTPTRLVDWSETLGVAVYFATLNLLADTNAEGENQSDPCVWILNPYRLNEMEWDGDLVHPPYLGWSADEGEYYTYGELLVEGSMDWNWPTAIYPRHRTDRIQAQNGWFTIHGDEFVPLETLKGAERFLRKVVLPRSAVDQARQFLQFSGINHFSIFADLESLSLHLGEKNGLISPKLAKQAEQARVQQRDSSDFYSCFISHSSKDEPFVRLLHARMRDAHIRVWLWQEDMSAGKPVVEQVENAIRAYDKLLIVLSEASLKSEWVMKEMREAFRAERQSGKRKLFPVRLTDYATLLGWECRDSASGQDLAKELRQYFIPDFSDWQDHDQFEASFARLLKDLKADSQA